jgi:hypothetical protein
MLHLFFDGGYQQRQPQRREHRYHYDPEDNVKHCVVHFFFPFFLPFFAGMYRCSFLQYLPGIVLFPRHLLISAYVMGHLWDIY